jgi:hypothetical protein
MPGEATGHASGGRNREDVGVPVILGAESDEGPVRRERRIGLETHIRRQPADVFSVEVGRPKIAGILEGDLGFSDRGLRQHAGIADIEPETRNRPGHYYRRQSNQRFLFHRSSPFLVLARGTEPGRPLLRGHPLKFTKVVPRGRRYLPL